MESEKNLTNICNNEPNTSCCCNGEHKKDIDDIDNTIKGKIEEFIDKDMVKYSHDLELCRDECSDKHLVGVSGIRKKRVTLHYVSKDSYYIYKDRTFCNKITKAGAINLPHISRGNKCVYLLDPRYVEEVSFDSSLSRCKIFTYDDIELLKSMTSLKTIDTYNVRHIENYEQLFGVNGLFGEYVNDVNVLIEKEKQNGEIFGVVEYNGGNYKYNVFNRNTFNDDFSSNLVKKIFLKGFEEAVVIKDNFLGYSDDLRLVNEIDLSSLRNVEHIGSDFLAGLSGVNSIDMYHMTNLKTIGKFVIRK